MKPKTSFPWFLTASSLDQFTASMNQATTVVASYSAIRPTIRHIVNPTCKISGEGKKQFTF